MATNRSIIYITMDVRGSGYRGKELLFTINNNLGLHEMVDIINVTRCVLPSIKCVNSCNFIVFFRILSERYSWIDKDKIGVWGWSYGGYASSMILTRDLDHVFKCGVAVAPVTSWLYYGIKVISKS
jgi:dipeptidyl-peptidase 4